MIKHDEAQLSNAASGLIIIYDLDEAFKIRQKAQNEREKNKESKNKHKQASPVKIIFLHG